VAHNHDLPCDDQIQLHTNSTTRRDKSTVYNH